MTIKAVKKQLPGVNNPLIFGSKKMRDILGIEPIPMKDMMIEMAYSMIENGFIPKKPGYKGKQ